MVESEGNGRMCTTLPETLITVCGIEKLVPAWQDLEVFLQLLVAQITRLADAGTLTGEQASLAKYTTTRQAREVASIARDMLGGNGITLEYSPLRHANNLESVRTYEGTDEVHTLILGRHITGQQAFR